MDKSCHKIIPKFLKENPSAWPFVEPVSGVADYYDIIKEPMGKSLPFLLLLKLLKCNVVVLLDLSTLSSCVENDEYKTLDEFVNDVNKIFNNCRMYNEEGKHTSYSTI